MKLLGIDIGTTHCKAGVFEKDGTEVRIAVRPTKTHYTKDGNAYYVPDELWKTIASCIKEAMLDENGSIAVVGITSMAETGVLLDLKTGKPKSNFIPWFDKQAMKKAELIESQDDPYKRFIKTGLHNSYKYGLSKILWLKSQNSEITKQAIWLTTSDYIAYKLTGNFGTDYSLAARTYAFRIDKKEWDIPWIRHFGLDESMFPEARNSGSKVGEVVSAEIVELGLSKGTPVAVSGHDHVCAAMAVGAVQPGTVFDSIGTAETLVGTLSEQPLGKEEFESGFSYGCHVAKGRTFWMGGIPSSGGSIEWMRKQLADKAISYEQILHLLEKVTNAPSGILYYPYLSGSGAPNPDSNAKAAFIGVHAGHNREDLVKAILEGTSYELESIRRTAEIISHSKIEKIISVGGGTRNQFWMQIKADVTNCGFIIPPISEATLLGAAVTAAIGCGIYASEREAITSIQFKQPKYVKPNQENYMKYKRLYENGYMTVQDNLRNYYKNNN